MREYELVIITQADLEEAAYNDALNKINGWITESGGEVAKTEMWGKRRLAYLIRKQSEGVYALLHVKMPASFGAQLERNLRFLEPVMRYLLVAKD
jgi:small subunit ribosomal protein S6